MAKQLSEWQREALLYREWFHTVRRKPKPLDWPLGTLVYASPAYKRFHAAFDKQNEKEQKEYAQWRTKRLTTIATAKDVAVNDQGSFPAPTSNVQREPSRLRQTSSTGSGARTSKGSRPARSSAPGRASATVRSGKLFTE